MRGMPFNLQGKGVIPSATAKPRTAEANNNISSSNNDNNNIILWSITNNSNKKEGVEPRSVLEHRRSPSPPTSTSTLSSSLGGGGNSTDTAGVAAVSDNPHQKWDTTTSSSAAEEGGRKDEWASELQPIPLEIGLVGGDKFGMGVDDWESMLSETPAAAAASSPGHDQSFLRWIMGDVVDDSSKQHHTMLSQGLPIPEDGAFAGLVDPLLAFEPIGGGAAGSTGVFSDICGVGNRILQIPPGSSTSASALPHAKVGFFGHTNLSTGFPPAAPGGFPLPPPPVFFQEPMEEKPQLFPPNVLLNLQQTQPTQSFSCYMPFNSYAQSEQQQHLLAPQPKRHHTMPDPSPQIGPKVPFSNPGQDLFLRRHQAQQAQQGFGSLQGPGSYHHLQQRPTKPKLSGDELSAAASHHQLQQQQQQQALIDQLLKVAELVEARNSVNAREILARLNHQLSPHGKPLIRSAFYFKEALNAILGGAPVKPPPGPMDVVLKLSAYKFFSEVSPVPQFINFTCIQVLLEELGASDHIHIVDFDIGIGGHWSSFMQELSHRRSSGAATTPSLKITAFVSPSSHHPLELALTRENLSHFASDLNIPFEFNILSVDSFDPAIVLDMSSGEAIAVNIPVSSLFTSTPTLLRLVKQLSPKIVVSVDHDCERGNLSFPQYFLNALQSTTVLLESIDAAGTNMEVANKIEKFLLQPRIENAILGRYHAADKMLTWRTLFASSGFIPVSFSNFTETQAECLLKRTQVRGFHVEKRQSSLLLFWQHGELVSVSAWKC